MSDPVKNWFYVVGGLTVTSLVVIPLMANRQGWFIGTERDSRIIEASQDCPPVQRNSSGKCVTTSRSVRSRRSFFDGGGK
jgi:hypothetical protein